MVDPDVSDFLCHNHNYKPWNYADGWEYRLVKTLQTLLSEIDSNAKQLPEGAEYDITLFKNVFVVLDYALRYKGATDSHDAERILDLQNVKKMIDDFGYNDETIQEINFLGDAFYTFNKGHHNKRYAELINRKRLEETSRLVYWVNPNRGEPHNSLNDHSVILWDEYRPPAPSKVKLVIKSISGINMAIKDKSGKSDPYVEIGQRIDGKWNLLHKTSVIKKELNPSWPELDAGVTVNTEYPLTFVVNDWDLIGHDFMGSWEVDVNVLLFLAKKYKKESIMVLQRYSGHKRSSEKEEIGWSPIVTGALEIDFIF